MTRAATKKSLLQDASADAVDIKMEVPATPPGKAGKLAKGGSPKDPANTSNDSPMSVATNLECHIQAEAKPSLSNSFVVFCVTNKAPTVCATKAEADAFRVDWGDFLSQEKHFPTQSGVDAFISTLPKPSPAGTPVKQVIDLAAPAPAPPGGMDRYARSLNAIRKAKPTNRFYARYKTNGASRKCIIVFEPVNYSGKAQWNVKPELLSPILKLFITDFADDESCVPIIKDRIFHEMITGMTHLRIRDPSGTPETPLQVTWTSPDKVKTIAYDQYVLCSHFTIPIDEIETRAMEHIFITSKLEAFILLLKDVLVSPAFAVLHEEACPKPTVWAAMNGLGSKTGGMTFQAYCKDAVPATEKCPNLNTYIVQEDTTALMNILWNGRISDGEQKYN